MKTIPISNGMAAIVDDADFERLSKLKWHVNRKDVAEGWPAPYASFSLPNRKIKHVRMHRYLLAPRPSESVDHINGNALDNRRENLRIATHSQNQANRRRLTRNTSGFKGVTWNKSILKWQAAIKVNGKSIHLGMFVNAADAAIAYDRKAVEAFGSFASTNASLGFLISREAA